jgi:large subunit ribosomal protein L10
VDNPRAEKAAVVTEVGERFDAAEAALLTEYRGLDVGALAELRGALRQAGGTYKIYKNTLVRIAARERGLDIDDLLTGPTAIAFVDGDVAGVAKALRDYARGNPNLVVKGGLLGESVLAADDVTALADLPSRDQLLAEIAGLFAAPMQQMASLLDAVPRSFAYALGALIEAGGAPGAPEAAAAPAEAADTSETTDAAPEAADETTPAEDSATTEADPADDTTPPADAGTDTPAESAETEES